MRRLLLEETGFQALMTDWPELENTVISRCNEHRVTVVATSSSRGGPIKPRLKALAVLLHRSVEIALGIKMIAIASVYIHKGCLVPIPVTWPWRWQE